MEATRQTEGYAVVLGLKDGELAKGLLQTSKLNVIVVDKDPKKIAASAAGSGCERAVRTALRSTRGRSPGFRVPALSGELDRLGNTRRSALETGGGEGGDAAHRAALWRDDLDVPRWISSFGGTRRIGAADWTTTTRMRGIP